MWWRTSDCSPLLIYRPREAERLSWPGWLTYSGRLTHISGHPSATGRAQDGKERWPETDVLPLIPPFSYFVDIMKSHFAAYNCLWQVSLSKQHKPQRPYDDDANK